MPTRERLSEFVATVISGRYVEAIEEFYAENASMRENQAEPRVGRDALVRALNEVALQIWSGDRILHEQFYYDPGQLR